MKHMFTFLFLMSVLSAHITDDAHPHFFSSMHVEDLTLVLICFIVGFIVFKAMKKEKN